MTSLFVILKNKPIFASGKPIVHAMNNKSILMPHACQKIGWRLLLLIPLVWGFYEILFHFFHETHLFAAVNGNSRFLTMVFYLVVIAAAFLICLSKEKVEDEMISQYRLKAIGVSAYVNFLVFLAFWLFAALDHGFRFGHGESWWGIVYGTMQTFFGLIPFTTAGLYYLVFKTMLRRSQKEQVL